jgi:hypothetical protein
MTIRLTKLNSMKMHAYNVMTSRSMHRYNRDNYINTTKHSIAVSIKSKLSR